MIRISSIFTLMLFLATPLASRPGGPVQDAADPASVPAVAIRTQPPGMETEPHEDSGETVWAEGYEGLILGLDGNLYEAYHPATIRHTQEVLRNRGLYAGPLHGVLDRPTMQAIHAFQEANYELQVCGIPTPRTRLLLEQGSHTS